MPFNYSLGDLARWPMRPQGQGGMMRQRFGRPAMMPAHASAMPATATMPAATGEVTVPGFPSPGQGQALPYTAADIPAMRQAMPFLQQNRRWAEWSEPERQQFINYFTARTQGGGQ